MLLEAREPRQWTINDHELRAGNRLGWVRWSRHQVRLVVEQPEVYLLCQTDRPHTATFDVPRDVLSPDQEGRAGNVRPSRRPGSPRTSRAGWPGRRR